MRSTAARALGGAGALGGGGGLGGAGLGGTGGVGGGTYSAAAKAAKYGKNYFVKGLKNRKELSPALQCELQQM